MQDSASLFLSFLKVGYLLFACLLACLLACLPVGARPCLYIRVALPLLRVQQLSIQQVVEGKL